MDVKYRELQTVNGTAYLFYVDEMCDPLLISRDIVAPLTAGAPFRPDKNVVMKGLLCACAVGEAGSVEGAVSHLMAGDSILLFDFLNEVIYCETKKIASRAVEKSDFEPTFMGPKEAFNESLNDNLALIRKRVADSALKVELYSVGEQSKTLVAFLFINGIAPKELVEYVRGQVTGYHCPYILSQTDIGEKMSMRKTTLETIGHTEKPDTLVSRLFEGRVAVLVNGCPLVLTAPHFFLENFQSADDYYSNRLTISCIRFLRAVSFFIALLLPGFFVALSTFHFSLIPTTFIFKLAVQRSGVPLPTVVEVILLQFFFELARESGKRLPQQVGQAISTVAALILGEAAVGAGITSEATVVVIGVYAIASFLNPKIVGTTYIWSLFIIVVSSILGLYGFYLAFVVFIAHVASLDTCGYPFLFPLGTVREFKFRRADLLFRGNAVHIKRKIL